MTIMLSAGNAGILGSAINWGYANTMQLATVGIAPRTLAGLDMRVSRGIPFDQDAAADAFRLVFVAEGFLSEPTEEITRLMAALTAVASPNAISRSARKFATSEAFVSLLEARLDEAMDAIDTINLVETAPQESDGGSLPVWELRGVQQYIKGVAPLHDSVWEQSLGAFVRE